MTLGKYSATAASQGPSTSCTAGTLQEWPPTLNTSRPAPTSTTIHREWCKEFPALPAACFQVIMFSSLWRDFTAQNLIPVVEFLVRLICEQKLFCDTCTQLSCFHFVLLLVFSISSQDQCL